MAGPYTGTWRQSVISGATFTGAAKWGTGINPVHSIPGDISIRGMPKLTYENPDLGPGDDAEYFIDDPFVIVPEDEPLAMYAYDAYPDKVWGFSDETGLTDRPMLDTRDQIPANQRVNLAHYPSWGGSRKTKPAGNEIRSMEHGALATNAMRVLPNETVGTGWLNKAHGIVGDALPSDDSQLVMNSSEIQRYKARAGSQSSGRASEYNAPIESRVVGQKLKVYPGEERHWDMTPYDQDMIIRPFLSRQVGTGYTEWQYPNEMYVADARQREPSPDPDPGTVTPGYDNQYSGDVYDEVVY